MPFMILQPVFLTNDSICCIFRTINGVDTFLVLCGGEVCPSVTVYLGESAGLQDKQWPYILWSCWRLISVRCEQRWITVIIRPSGILGIHPYTDTHFLRFYGVGKSILRQHQIISAFRAGYVLEYLSETFVFHWNYFARTYDFCISGSFFKGIDVDGSRQSQCLVFHNLLDLFRRQFFVIDCEVVKHESRIGIAPVERLISA